MTELEFRKIIRNQSRALHTLIEERRQLQEQVEDLKFELQNQQCISIVDKNTIRGLEERVRELERCLTDGKERSLEGCTSVRRSVSSKQFRSCSKLKTRRT